MNGDTVRSMLLCALVTTGAVAGLTQAVRAQQSPPAPAEPPSGDAAPATEQDDEPVPPPATTPSKPAAAKGSPQRFEPTEKVRPDFDVAFPVDI